MNDIRTDPSTSNRGVPHSSHWGAFSVLSRERGIEIVPHPRDRDPSALLGNIPAAVSHRARIARPMVRRGWLERGPGADARRGRDELVPLSWPEALDLVAAELRRVYAAHGPRAVFGGSYGWASAGRFHDAQHQLHRFLNLAGGYVRSVNSYSSGAASVILPHVIGPQGAVAGNNVSWAELVGESALVLAFGGMALKNNDVGGGGTGQHVARGNLEAARRRGAEFHLIGPLARRSAGRDRGGLAPDPPRHRCSTDAGAGAHPRRRGAARPRLPRPLLRRLGDIRGLSLRPRRRPAEGCGLGGGDLRPCRRTRSLAWRGGRSAGAPSSPARSPCSAPSMASSRCGWAWCWPPCSVRSGCRAAALPMRWARPRTPASRHWRCRCRPCRPAGTAFPTSSRSRASPICCSIRASRSTTTASASSIPTSGWSTGPAAIRFTTTRI